MQQVDRIEAYSQDENSHNFAVWTASRAAFRGYNNNKRSLSALTERLLRECDLTSQFTVRELPEPEKFDVQHKVWRNKMVDMHHEYDRDEISHGRAAKIINIYLKTRFLGSDDSILMSKLGAVHPPVDRELLAALDKYDVAGMAKQWNKFKKSNWTKFSSERYEEVILALRGVLDGQPLWKIEVYWHPK